MNLEKVKETYYKSLPLRLDSYGFQVTGALGPVVVFLHLSAVSCGFNSYGTEGRGIGSTTTKTLVI